jgi:hypothetical protein
MKGVSTVCCMAALALNSCVYVTTNLGGFTNDLGVQKALRVSVTQEPEPDANAYVSANPQDFQIYKLGNAYYMKMYITYAQKKTALFKMYTVFGEDRFCELWSPNKVRIASLTPEPYMVLMEPTSGYRCLRIKQVAPPQGALHAIPYDEFDFSTAQQCKVNLEKAKDGGYFNNQHYTPNPRLPEQKYAIHYALKPVSWALTAVDFVPQAVQASAFGLFIWLPSQIAQTQDQPQQPVPAPNPR